MKLSVPGEHNRENAATALATLLIPFILVKAGVESARARNN